MLRRGDACGRYGYQQGGRGSCSTARRISANDPVYGQLGGGDRFLYAGYERGRSSAAHWVQGVTERNFLEFDAEKVRAHVAQVLNGVAFDAAWADAKRSLADRRTHHDEERDFVVGEADFSGFVEIDVDGREF